MKKLLLILSMAAMLLIPGIAAHAQLDSLPPELRTRIEDLLATRFPPQLHSVKLSSDAPAAGEAVTVTAEVSNDSEVTDDETTAAYVFYSTDGGKSWQEVEMESEDQKTWTGEIPGQDSGTQVIWGVRAVDSSANFYTDAPCKMAAAVPTDDYTDCAAGGDLAACETYLPMNGCMVAMANDEEPVNDEDGLIPADFDMVNFRFGYDDDNMYIDLQVEGEVSDGKAAPMNIHGYAAAVLNPDAGGNSTDLNDLLSSGAIIVHAPLAKIAGGLLKPCFWGYKQGNDFVQDDKAVTCKNKANHLYLTVKRSAVKNNPSNQLEFLAADLAVTSISPIAGTAYDNTRVTQVNMIDRNYTVQ